MEMKVDKSFFMLEKKDKGKSITLYDKMEDAVKKISECMGEGIKASQLDLTEITVEENELRVTTIPWSTIAEKLVKL